MARLKKEMGSKQFVETCVYYEEFWPNEFEPLQWFMAALLLEVRTSFAALCGAKCSDTVKDIMDRMKFEATKGKQRGKAQEKEEEESLFSDDGLSDTERDMLRSKAAWAGFLAGAHREHNAHGNNGRNPGSEVNGGHTGVHHSGDEGGVASE